LCELICVALQRGGRDAGRGTYVLTPKENQLFEQYYKVRKLQYVCNLHTGQA